MTCSRTAILRLTALALVLLTAGLAAVPHEAEQTGQSRATSATPRDAGLTAWQQVYSVLTHPRCLNCHTAGDYPQQGDERRRHLFNVVRGPNGIGVPGLNCATCHQDANADSTGVPGSHNWHLAPLSMAWQDRNDQTVSSAELCRVLTDRSKNHNMDGPALLKHHAEDRLVGWAWEPGRGLDGVPRSRPPLSRPEFTEATRRWVKAGTPCPPAGQAVAQK